MNNQANGTTARFRQVTAHVPTAAIFPLHSPNGAGCDCHRQDCDSPAKHPRTMHGLKDATRDPERILEWWQLWPQANVGLATGPLSGVVVLDVDERHGGGESLAALEAEYGSLPPTVRVLTGNGFHVYFSHPDAEIRNSAGNLGAGLDVRGAGGYVVAPGSQHMNGRWYEWEAGYSPEDVTIAPVPDWLLRRVLGDTQKSGAGRYTFEEGAFEVLSRDVQEGGRHAAALRVGGYLARYLPADAALESLRNWNTQHCKPPLADEEVAKVAAYCSRKQGAPESLPLEVSIDEPAFWSARPQLQGAYDFALARHVSPWAVLGAALARAVAATPPSVVLPALIGDYASLNLFCALVGAPGAGKGGADRTAKLFLAMKPEPFRTHSIGTGQGITRAYASVNRGVIVRHATAALLVADEIDHVAGHQAQNGSTLLAELRRVWMGEQLGHLYADAERRVEIEAHTYRAAIVVGVQAAKAGVLLDDIDGGTPQRFVWLPATYKDLPDEWGEPAPLGWTLPAIPHVDGPYVMPVCEQARHEIVSAHLARQRGEGDALDGHLLLCREKVAAGLALLSGGIEITDEDWSLAGTVIAVSQQTRTDVLATVAATKRARVKDYADRQAFIAGTVEEQGTSRAFVVAQGQAVRHVKRHAGADGCSRRCLSRAIASDVRKNLSLDDLLADAVTRDMLKEDADTYWPGAKA